MRSAAATATGSAKGRPAPATVSRSAHTEREGDPLALVSGNATYKYTAVGGSIYYLCGSAVCAGGAQTADTNNESIKCGTVAADSETITTYQGFIMLDAATVDLQLRDGDSAERAGCGSAVGSDHDVRVRYRQDRRCGVLTHIRPSARRRTDVPSASTRMA